MTEVFGIGMDRLDWGSRKIRVRACAADSTDNRNRGVSARLDKAHTTGVEVCPNSLIARMGAPAGTSRLTCGPIGGGRSLFTPGDSTTAVAIKAAAFAQIHTAREVKHG
ncbi:hypothetical protein PhaeoP75_04220 (plasmid) [Phaeobacter gallaeciensis]|uniref:Uncharacterized protein n=1 Tax=Phaeobacter gallaeciensis TaxID=60890 RepID=A0AAD0EEW7_9RHOB|nr:hypothetical protein Gal_04145 [Phaeobacter gallaeciensis DSM 26640]ATE95116.1 hypothetical protein PhaeoP11_04130 [Phaeobacter gallaeciensis]ATE99424.1 hypothetical protein PhaeoP73_04163 [Phaeobacter gallaeciensis]ATF03821.1 hypothetical protein PhaeoP75_04220 [Phaeobacter gallaeciensis]ATF08014.1 hypothetical protein PhaeoP63_03982 [Phaeobacter gallaeciensis]